ncbi:MAG: hypothetical protein ACLUSS_05615 [Faecalibacterium sp.]
MDALTNNGDSTILQTEGALTAKGQLSIPVVKKIDRQAWNTVAVNLFCYHRFSSEKSSP